MEARLFPEGEIPEYTMASWYSERDHAGHLEEDAHRGRLEIAAKFINESGVESVVDLGCGDGGLLSLLKPEIRAWGYDLQKSNVDASVKRNVDVRYGNVLEDNVEWGQLAVLTEFIEHVIDPRGLVRYVAEHCDRIVASSPYTETVDNAYPFHCWAFDIDGYTEMLRDGGFESKRIETWSMFQVHYAERIR